MLDPTKGPDITDLNGKKYPLALSMVIHGVEMARDTGQNEEGRFIPVGEPKYALTVRYGSVLAKIPVPVELFTAVAEELARIIYAEDLPVIDISGIKPPDSEYLSKSKEPHE